MHSSDESKESYSGGEEEEESEEEQEGAYSDEDDKEMEVKITKRVSIDKSYIKKYDVIVVTEIFHDIGEMIKLNEICRKLHKGFILAQCLGVYGYSFTDFGDEFVCKDKTGEEHKSFNVVGITNAKKPEVTVHKSKYHSFSNGDHVVFKEVKGMEEINDQPIKITVIDAYTIQLDIDTTHFSKYKRDGIVTSVSIPEKFKFLPLKDSLKNPTKVEPGYLTNADLANFGRSEQLHIGLQAIYAYQNKNRRLPMNKRAEVHEVLDLAISMNKELKKDKEALSVEKVDSTVIKLMSKFSRNQVTPLTSFFGGIVAQEVIKYTGKFTPTPCKFSSF
jgi:ubiquitin-activating enzyme E1